MRNQILALIMSSFVTTIIEQVAPLSNGISECPVCLEEHDLCKMMVTSCNHHLCTGCTNGIIEASNKVICPMCREHCHVLTTEDMESFYDVIILIQNKNHEYEESLIDPEIYEEEPNRLESLLSGGRISLGNF